MINCISSIAALWSHLLQEPIELEGYTGCEFISPDDMLEIMQKHNLQLPGGQVLVAYASVDAKGMPTIAYKATTYVEASGIKPCFNATLGGFPIATIVAPDLYQSFDMDADCLFFLLRLTDSFAIRKIRKATCAKWLADNRGWFHMLYGHCYYWMYLKKWDGIHV